MREIANEPDFTVIDEGEGYIVVNKPAPLLVHPSTPGNPTTLLDGLQALLSYELANGGQLSIINRLDRETSGTVLIAKDRYWARRFSIAMQRRRMFKRYQALVWGWPDEEEFVVDEPILRAGEVEESAVWVRQRVHPDGAASMTRFRVLEQATRPDGEKVSLIEAHPMTGRMHQIRVHLHHAGYPVVGDKIYGRTGSGVYLEFIETGWTDTLGSVLVLPRQALHSCWLATEIDDVGYEWEAPIPPEFQEFLAGLEK
jgi:23S rRNA pseudouridine1911/1915/1917 synthase